MLKSIRPSSLLFLSMVLYRKTTCTGQTQTFHTIHSYSCTAITLNADVTNKSSIILVSVRYSKLVCRNSAFGLRIADDYKTKLNCSVDVDTDTVTFCFYNITPADSGVYNVTLGNYNGSTIVYVMGKPTLPTISPTFAEEGKMISLTCTTTSTSSPTGQTFSYTWTVDGAPPSDSRYQVSGDKLTIQTVQSGDKNRVFQCLAKENNGQSSDKKDQSINVTYTPVVSITPSSVDPKDGDKNLRLTCSVDEANPSAISGYTWYKNNSPNIVLSQQQTYTIATVTRNHAGVYHCKAENSVGLSVSPASVTVFVQYTPVVSISPSIVNPVEGDKNLRLTCSVNEANPRNISGYTWYKNNSPNIILSQQLTYTIATVNRSHAGVYHCKAENSIGLSVSPASVTVNVLYKPSVTINMTSTRITTALGQRWAILCEVTDGNPRTSVSYMWKKQNIEVSNSSTYVISRITKQDDGTYGCSATNTAGTSETASVSVNVQYGPTIYCINNKAVEEGKILNVMCTVDANPRAILAWKQIGQIINISSESNLNINNISRNQAGSYILTATNTLTPTGQTSIPESATHTVIVDVQYGPGNSLTLTPNTIAIEESSTRDLPSVSCSADCNPACTYTWSGSVSSSTNQLQLGKANRIRNGTYTCAAVNTVERTQRREASRELTVLIYYGASIKGIAINGSATHKEHENVTMTCSVDSYPVSNITWKDDRMGEIQHSTGLTSYLKIHNAGCLQTGTYTCSAFNRYGTPAISTVKLFVKCSPRLQNEDDTETIGIATGEYLNLSVTLLAYPKPSVNWYFSPEVSDNNITLPANYVKNLTTNTFSSSISTFLQDEEDFGSYFILANNSESSMRPVFIKIFHVIPRGPPSQPSGVAVDCTSYSSANISWRSSFNGGESQVFTVLYKQNKEEDFAPYRDNISSKGKDFAHFKSVNELLENTEYFFKIMASNSLGGIKSVEVNCTTASREFDTEGQTALIGGIAGTTAAVVVIVIGIVVIVLMRRIRNKMEDEKAKSNNMPLTQNSAEFDDGIKDNILYVSAGPSQEQNNTDVYAVVEKNNKKKKSNDQMSDVYAEVKKTNKKEKKKVLKDDKKKQITGDVYENVDDFSKKKPCTSADAVYSNNPPQEERGTRNQDGLLYVEVDLRPVPEERRNVIIGEEERTDYASVDFILPESAGKK